jgi:N-methylhydantoinase A
VSTERGHDLARFALFAYGGAGPIHALDVAYECGIPTVVVPIEPGTLCAKGMLLADVSFDFVRSVIATSDEESWRRVAALFREMQREAAEWLSRERVGEADRLYLHQVDARYEGQNYEVAVPLASFGAADESVFRAGFAAAHRREYGYDIPNRPIEIVNCRLQAIGRVTKAPHGTQPGATSVRDALAGRRKVYFGASEGWIDTPIYERARLGASMAIAGPAVIEEMSSTVVLAPGQSARVDRIGNLVIDVAPAAEQDRL